jgi:hypothetical protein
MDFIIGALVMLLGVFVGAAILSTAMAKTLPARKNAPQSHGTTHTNVTVIPTQSEREN